MTVAEFNQKLVEHGIDPSKKDGFTVKACASEDGVVDIVEVPDKKNEQSDDNN